MANQEPEGLTSLEAMGIAIRSEMDARDTYRELAARAADPVIRRRFENLAADEEQHLTYLKERYSDLAGDVPLLTPPSQLPKGMTTPAERRHKTLREVLDMAIEEERLSREFYLAAARRTPDPSGQEMFRFLADMEYRHWMELNQERDLLVRYPNYGQTATPPWRAEKSLKGSGKGA